MCATASTANGENLLRREFWVLSCNLRSMLNKIKSREKKTGAFGEVNYQSSLLMDDGCNINNSHFFQMSLLGQLTYLFLVLQQILHIKMCISVSYESL